MVNAEIFKQTFGIYATELWAMNEKDFLSWLNGKAEGAKRGNRVTDGTLVAACDEEINRVLVVDGNGHKGRMFVPEGG